MLPGSGSMDFQAYVMRELSCLRAEMERQRSDFQRQLTELRQSSAPDSNVDVLKHAVSDTSTSDSDKDEDKRPRFGSMVTLDGPPEDERCYSLQASIWDVGVFVMCDWLPIHDSLVLMTAFGINTILQILFAYFIMEEFGGASIDSELVASYLDWRLTSGHAFSFARPIDNSPLVQRVCDQDQTLTTASAYKSVVENLGRWISMVQDSDWDARFYPKFGSTFWLAILALVLWILTVFGELRLISEFASAIISLPIQHHASCHIHAADGVLKLVGFNYRRVVWSVIILLVRIGVAITLLAVGGIWLMQTERAEDLILNAAALAFVMDCDELIYGVFCPSSLQYFVETLEPLPLKRGTSRNGLITGFLVTLPVLTVVFYQRALQPTMELRREAYEVLCGGDRHFVVNKDALDRVFVTYPVQNMSGMEDWYEANSGFRRIADTEKQLTDEYIHHRYGRGYWQPDDRTAAKLRISSLYELTELLGCDDSKGLLRQSYSALGNLSVRECADVKPFCADTSSYARAMCPQTCGCEDPRQGLMFWKAGCPRPQCVLNSQRRQQILDVLPCKDWTAAELASQTGWSNAVAGLEVYLLRAYVENSNRTRTRIMGQSLMDYGCLALDNPGSEFWRLWHELVQQVKARRHSSNSSSFDQEVLQFMCDGPFSTFCPKTCGCEGVEAWMAKANFCPKTCGGII